MDQGGKKWLGSGCTVIFRELTRFCDRLDVGYEGEN